jgi:hypothetical protein
VATTIGPAYTGATSGPRRASPGWPRGRWHSGRPTVAPRDAGSPELLPDLAGRGFGGDGLSGEKGDALHVLGSPLAQGLQGLG